MEVHKLQTGAIYVVGYISKNDLDRLQNTSTTLDVDVTIFFTPYKEYSRAYRTRPSLVSALPTLCLH
jgi:hypothetical protein